MTDLTPAYSKLLESGELERRAAEAVAVLSDCAACPRDCRVHRSEEEGFCATGRHARISSFFPHHGEEAPLRGWRGSGTIFFSWCNLHCVFCQNSDISQKPSGEEVTAEQLAQVMLHLQELGCHNINLVTPTHVVPQILEALVPAARAGLRLPLVYNSSGYDSPETLRRLDGVVDIYMPDFKYWDPERAERLLTARDYPAVARSAIREMHRQVGDLELDEQGVARRGLLVRHLVMPNAGDDSRAVLDWLAREVSPRTYVNVMGQYRPAHRAHAHEGIDRRVRPDEVADAVRHAEGLGLRLDGRSP